MALGDQNFFAYGKPAIVTGDTSFFAYGKPYMVIDGTPPPPAEGAENFIFILGNNF